MKDEWNSRLENGRDVDYSKEPDSEEPGPESWWRITAQARDSDILHTDSTNGPISKQEVETRFREDLMKER